MSSDLFLEGQSCCAASLFLRQSSRLCVLVVEFNASQKKKELSLENAAEARRSRAVAIR
jgi:hypothetical protein